MKKIEDEKKNFLYRSHIYYYTEVIYIYLYINEKLILRRFQKCTCSIKNIR